MKGPPDQTPGVGCLTNNVGVMGRFLDAGVSTPDDEVSFGRAQDRLFVWAKGPKTIDAPSGFIEEEGRELFEERPNSPGSHKGRQMRRASLLWASRQASEQNQRVPSQTQEGGPIRGDYPGPTQKGLTTARLFSGTDCTARPYHQAREI